MNIYESINKIMEEIPAIKKEKNNTQQGFKFRGIDDVMNTLHPLLSKNNVFIVPQVIEQTRENRTTSKGGSLIYSICKIKYTFYAEDGSFIETITIGEGMDSGDKATNKAMAIAMKYALFQVFCIPTDDIIDPDGETPEPSTPANSKISPKIEAALREAIKNNNISSDDVLTTLSVYGCKKLADLSIDQLNDFKNKIGVS